MSPSIPSTPKEPLHGTAARKLPPVGFRPLRPNVEPPVRETAGSLGYDVRAAEDAIVPPNYSVLIPTGFAVELPPGVAFLIIPRSGLAHRDGLVVSNSPGLADSDYRGEIFVALYNRGSEKFRVAQGDRIAQILFVPALCLEFEVKELTPSERDKGGFGSTGVK